MSLITINQKKLLSLIFSGCLAMVYLSLNFSNKKTNFEDATAFEADSNTIYSKVSGHLIHCIDSRNCEDCIEGVKERGAKQSALWLGNSQVQTINRWKEGDTNGVPILFSKLKSEGLDLVAFSEPNAELQEDYVLFEYLRTRIPLRVLILAICFDKTRDEGLRNGIVDFLENTTTANAISQTNIGKKMIALNKDANSNGESDTAGISNTFQEKVEKVLNVWLEANCKLWAARPETRGRFFNFLYQTRNTLFGIKPTSRRKIIRGCYLDNLAALEAILESASQSGIKVILYNQPIRNDVELPYDEGEYDVFKSDVQHMAAQHNAYYVNLENLVPGPLWGTKNGTSLAGKQELDFMHFSAEGHRLLANQLAVAVNSAMGQKAHK